MRKIKRKIPPRQAAKAKSSRDAKPKPPASYTDRLLHAFFDCSFTRMEIKMSVIALACTVALQLEPVLTSKLADILIVIMAFACWTTPVTAFYFISCGQVLPFPETSAFNPAQIGVLTWPIVALLYHRKIYFKNWVMLLPLLPFLFWFTLIAESLTDMLSMRSEYVKVVIYAFIAGHYAALAKGKYLKCLLGLSLGALSIVTTWWALQAGLPVQLYEYEGSMDREGFERLGSQRADAVMVWPPILMGTFGAIGVAMTHTFAHRSQKQSRALMTVAIVGFSLAIPPLLETMTHGAYGGFIIMSGLVIFTMYNNLLSSKMHVKTKSRLMRLILLPVFGLGIVIATDTFQARSRITGLWEYYQEESEKESIAASRTDVWTYAVQTIAKYPLLGFKKSGEKEEIPKQYRASGGYVAHNVFLDYGRYSGIPGMLLIAYFFFVPIVRLVGHRRHKLYYGFYFAYFVMFIFWMTLSFQFYKTFWGLWMLVAQVEVTMRTVAQKRTQCPMARSRRAPRRPRRASHPARIASMDSDPPAAADAPPQENTHGSAT